MRVDSLALSWFTKSMRFDCKRLLDAGLRRLGVLVGSGSFNMPWVVDALEGGAGAGPMEGLT